MKIIESIRYVVDNVHYYLYNCINGGNINY